MCTANSEKLYSAHSDPSGHRTLHKVVKIQVTPVRRYFAQDANNIRIPSFRLCLLAGCGQTQVPSSKKKCVVRARGDKQLEIIQITQINAAKN